MAAYMSRLLRSSIFSISLRDDAFTNSETDLYPNSECRSMNSLMLKYSSEGIFTSLYDLAIDVIYGTGINNIFDIYGEIFINRYALRHICLKGGAI